MYREPLEAGKGMICKPFKDLLCLFKKLAYHNATYSAPPEIPPQPGRAGSAKSGSGLANDRNWSDYKNNWIQLDPAGQNKQRFASIHPFPFNLGSTITIRQSHKVQKTCFWELNPFNNKLGIEPHQYIRGSNFVKARKG